MMKGCIPEKGTKKAAGFAQQGMRLGKRPLEMDSPTSDLQKDTPQSQGMEDSMPAPTQDR